MAHPSQLTIINAAPWPTEPLTLNRRLHHMARYRAEQAWQQAAYMHAGPATRRLIRGIDAPDGWNVQVTFCFPRRVRRDPHNWVSTVKPIIDGLTHLGLWDDDDDQHLSVLDSRLVAAVDSHQPSRTFSVTLTTRRSLP